MQAKRNYAILLFAFLMLFLTGCVESQLHIKVNRDGSGVYEFQIVTNRFLISQFDELKEQMKKKGYHISTINAGNDRRGWKAVKEVDNVAREIPTEEILSGINSAIRHFQSQIASSDPAIIHLADKPNIQTMEDPFQIDHGFFFTTITLNTQFDLTNMTSNEFDLYGLDELVYDGMNLRFLLTLPVKVDDHNATEVSQDGKTLTWVIKPGETNPIYMSLKLPNLITWSVFAIGGLFFLILFIVLYIRNKKKPHPPTGSAGGSSQMSDTISPAPDSFRWG